MQLGGPNNSNFPQNWFPPEITSTLFNLYTFNDPEKSPPESCRKRSDVMNGHEFRPIKLLKLKYRKGDQIIQTFCKIGSPDKRCRLSLVCRNFKTLQKVILNHAECIEI